MILQEILKKEALIKDLQEAKKVAEKQLVGLKAALLAEMQENGVVKEDYEHHTVSLQNGRKSVSILDDNAVPNDLCNRIPDKSKVKKYLDLYPDTNWAKIEVGEPFLTIRSKN